MLYAENTYHTQVVVFCRVSSCLNLVLQDVSLTEQVMIQMAIDASMETAICVSIAQSAAPSELPAPEMQTTNVHARQHAVMQMLAQRNTAHSAPLGLQNNKVNRMHQDHLQLKPTGLCIAMIARCCCVLPLVCN